MSASLKKKPAVYGGFGAFKACTNLKQEKAVHGHFSS